MSPNNIPVYGASSSTPTTTATAPSSGTFPQGSTTATAAPANASMTPTSLKVNGQPMTAAQFGSDYGVSSSQLATYLLPTGGLNANADLLAYYHGLNQQERQQLQSEMANAGLISASAVNGLDSSVSRDAFKALIGQTSAQGTDPFSFLSQADNRTNSVQNQLSSTIASASKSLSTPSVASITNSSTLGADITQAFNQALGYSPNKAQVDAFIQQIQSQETSYGSANKQVAQQQITNAQSVESALNKLGPDGIDTVISAYQHAVSGSKMPGAGTTQGPVNGSVPASNFGNPLPGSPTKPGDSFRFTPQGTEVGANVLPTAHTGEAVQSGGLWNDVANFVEGNPGGPQIASMRPLTTYTQSPAGVAPQEPSGSIGSVPTHGGLFALSPSEWQKAKELYSPASKYATAGAAPQAIQQAAFTALLTSEYTKNGDSWSKAITAIATGSPFGTAEGTHLSSFGTNLANEVNSQITSLQQQAQGGNVTMKFQAPDSSGAYSAEASNAAKAADPVGYYAANYASFADLVNRSLAADPMMYNQGTSDPFNGPVGAQSGAPAAGAASAATVSGGK